MVRSQIPNKNSLADDKEPAKEAENTIEIITDDIKTNGTPIEITRTKTVINDDGSSEERPKTNLEIMQEAMEQMRLNPRLFGLLENDVVSDETVGCGLSPIKEEEEDEDEMPELEDCSDDDDDFVHVK